MDPLLTEALATGVLVRAVDGDPSGTLRPVDGGPDVASVLAALLAAEPDLAGLDVAVTDAQTDAAGVIAALLADTRPALRRLAIRQAGFDPNRDEEPEDLAVPGAALAEFATRLPALVDLELDLHSLAEGLAHPTLRSLAMVGIPITALWERLDLPRLETLRWRLPDDIHGVAIEPSALADLWPLDRDGEPFLPALTEIDFLHVEFDGSVWGSGLFAAGSRLARLEVLRVRWLVDGEVDIVREHREHLAHLRLLEVRHADDAALAMLPALRVAAAVE